MDPLGFALENYDPIGRLRDQEAGQPIDAAASFPDGTTFRGARELQQMLSGPDREAFVRCFTEKLLTFALGRGLEYQDECVVDEVLRRTQADGYRVHSIISVVAESDVIKKRQRRGSD
jgi:hypothetical protein